MSIEAVLPERCLVTLLAFDVVSSTMHVIDCDPDEIQLFQDLIFERVQSCVNESSGHIISFAGDGGIAVFGWPDSVESHADLALIAAHNILKIAKGSNPIISPRGENVGLRVGVHSGLVGIRQITLANVSRPDTVGETVHLAVTLEKSAPADTALISSDTLALCNWTHTVVEHSGVHAFESETRQAHLLITSANRENQADKIPDYATSLIGRGSELAQLTAALPDERSKFCFFGLTGEAGIGKSRLVAEVVKLAAVSGCAVIVAFGGGTQNSAPFTTVRQVLTDLARNAGTGFLNLRRKLRNEFGFSEIDADTVMVALGQSPKHRPSSDNPRAKAKVYVQMAEVISRLAAGSPLLLVVEDLHWVDPESFECFRVLARDMVPTSFTLLVTGRTEADAKMRQFGDRLIDLRPLKRQEMLALGYQLASDISNTDINKVLEKADGVPFILEQIILSMKSSKHVSPDFMPMSVQSLIHARLNHLSHESKVLAQTLSIIGQTTSLPVATKVTGYNSNQLAEKLSELEKHQFIFPGYEIIRFRHQILCEACKITLPRARAIAIHKDVIKAISATYTNLDPLCMKLAFHAKEAELPQKELDFLLRAAQHARRTSAMQSLKVIFGLAVEAIEKTPADQSRKYLDFVLLTGPALLQIGEFDLVEPHFPKALAYARSEGSEAELCGTLCQSATLDWFEGRFLEGKQHSSQALSLARKLDRMPLLFSALITHSILCWVTADIDEAIELQEEICSKFGGAKQTLRLGAAATPSVMASVFLGWSVLERGDHLRAQTLGAEAVDISTELEDAYGTSLALNFLGFTKFVSGNFEESAVVLERALVLCERNGFDNSRATVIGNLCAGLARIGEYNRARMLVAKWIDEDNRHCGVVEKLYALRGIADANHAWGNRSNALVFADRAVDLACSINSPCFEARMLETRIMINIANENAEDQLSSDRIRLADLKGQFRLAPLFLR